jgi:hypothetical protein
MAPDRQYRIWENLTGENIFNFSKENFKNLQNCLNLVSFYYYLSSIVDSGDPLKLEMFLIDVRTLKFDCLGKREDQRLKRFAMRLENLVKSLKISKIDALKYIFNLLADEDSFNQNGIDILNEILETRLGDLFGYGINGSDQKFLKRANRFNEVFKDDAQFKNYLARHQGKSEIEKFEICGQILKRYFDFVAECLETSFNVYLTPNTNNPGRLITQKLSNQNQTASFNQNIPKKDSNRTILTLSLQSQPMNRSTSRKQLIPSILFTSPENLKTENSAKQQKAVLARKLFLSDDQMTPSKSRLNRKSKQRDYISRCTKKIEQDLDKAAGLTQNTTTLGKSNDDNILIQYANSGEGRFRLSDKKAKDRSLRNLANVKEIARNQFRNARRKCEVETLIARSISSISKKSNEIEKRVELYNCNELKNLKQGQGRAISNSNPLVNPLNEKFELQRSAPYCYESDEIEEKAVNRILKKKYTQTSLGASKKVLSSKNGTPKLCSKQSFEKMDNALLSADFSRKSTPRNRSLGKALGKGSRKKLNGFNNLSPLSYKYGQIVTDFALAESNKEKCLKYKEILDRNFMRSKRAESVPRRMTQPAGALNLPLSYIRKLNNSNSNTIKIPKIQTVPLTERLSPKPITSQIAQIFTNRRQNLQPPKPLEPLKSPSTPYHIPSTSKPINLPQQNPSSYKKQKIQTFQKVPTNSTNVNSRRMSHQPAHPLSLKTPFSFHPLHQKHRSVSYSQKSRSPSIKRIIELSPSPRANRPVSIVNKFGNKETLRKIIKTVKFSPRNDQNRANRLLNLELDLVRRSSRKRSLSRSENVKGGFKNFVRENKNPKMSFRRNEVKDDIDRREPISEWLHNQMINLTPSPSVSKSPRVRRTYQIQENKENINLGNIGENLNVLDKMNYCKKSNQWDKLKNNKEGQIGIKINVKRVVKVDQNKRNLVSLSNRIEDEKDEKEKIVKVDPFESVLGRIGDLLGMMERNKQRILKEEKGGWRNS